MKEAPLTQEQIAQNRREGYNRRRKTPALPYIRFPAEWAIRFVEPFGGALIRFSAEYRGFCISVYFDDLSALGAMPRPYWEIYPAADGDTARFYLDETNEMLYAMHLSFQEHTKDMHTKLVTLYVTRGTATAELSRTYNVAAPEGHHLRAAERLARSEGWIVARTADGAVKGSVEDEG